MNTKSTSRRLFHLVRLFTCASLVLTLITPLASIHPAYAQGTPGFLVRSDQDQIHAMDWPPGATLTLTVDDPGTTLNPDYDASTTVVDGYGNFELGGIYDVQPGFLVTLSDGVTTLNHTVTQLNIYDVDETNDLVYGTAEPGSSLAIEAPAYDSNVGVLRFLTADGNGMWMADFRNPGSQPGEEGTYDITWGSSAEAYQDQGDGSTYVSFDIPWPKFWAIAERDSVNGWEWLPNTTITVILNGTDTYTTASDDGGSFNLDLNGQFDIQPGNHIEVSDGQDTKILDVVPLAITQIDLAADTVSGTADPGVEVSVWFHNDEGVGVTVTTNAAGQWLADFTNIRDLVPGLETAATVTDADGDETYAGYSIPNPTFAVRPDGDSIDGWSWAVNSSVTVTLNGTFSIQAGTDEWGNFSANLDGQYDIVPGTVVEVTDGTSIKSHTVTSLTITGVDVDTDIVSGTASPNGSVQVWVNCDEFGCINRWESVDASGNWQADFSIPGDEPGEEQIADIQLGTWVDSGEWDDDGDNTNAGFNIPNPTFSVRPNGDSIDGWSWVPNSQVSITLDASLTVQASTDEWGNFNANLDGQYDIIPDTVVDVTDGTSSKSHTVTHLTITGVDVDTDIVSGTASPNGSVQVWVNCDEFGCINRWEIVDASGNWQADFSVPGDEPGEEQTADIQLGTWVDSGEWDDDGDSTNAGYTVPNPSIQAQPDDDWIQGWGWELGSLVNLTIDDPLTGAEVDYSASQTAHVANWDPNQVVVEFDLTNGGYDLKAGDIVQLSAGTILKEHTVAYLTVTGFDTLGDTISGKADPGALVDLWAHDDCCWNIQMQANAAGNWTADLTTVGYDLHPGSDGATQISDADGDSTWVHWGVPNPQFVVQLANNNVDGWGWASDAQLTINIDGALAATLQTDPDGNFSVNFGELPAFVPSMVFEISDGITTKSVTTADLQVTAVDPGADTVSGLAPANQQLNVWVHGENAPNVQVTANGSGQWTADFAGMWDIGPGSDGAAQIDDDDGDGTWVGWNVPNPTFAVRLFDAQVEGWEWPLGADVTLTIDDPATPGTDYSDTQTVVVADWDPNQTSVRFDFNYVYFLKPGDIVTLSDGNVTKTHMVVDLGITDVNVDLDTVSGTADPDTQVDLWICEEWGCVNRHVTAAPDGSWLADFANPGPQNDEQGTYDIIPGTSGDVAQQDDDGDSTQIWWNISNPQLEASYEHDWVQISGFTPDGQVTYTIFDYEGGHALFGPVTGPVDSHGNGWIANNLHHTDLIPGMFISALDETTGEEVTLTIGELNLDYISAADDRAFGTAEPNSTVELNVNVDHNSGFNLTTGVDGNGYWEVDLAAAGHPINTFRHADVRLYDAEGDSVIAQNPRIHAQVATDNFGVDNFSKNSDVTLTLSDSSAGTVIYGPVTLRSDGSGSVWVNLWELGIDLQVGQTITAYDHVLDFTKTLTIEPFTFDVMDTDGDFVSGTSLPGEWVELHVESLFSNWGLDALTDSSSQWTRNYGQEGYDLTPQMWAYGWAIDDQGNWSEDHTTGLPNIEASIADDWISGWNFSPERPVRVDIYTFEGGSLLSSQTTTAGGDTRFQMDNWQHGVDLQPGMYIFVEDLETGKTSNLTLANLTFDNIDYDADTAAGTADPGAQVVVSADWLFDHYEILATADASGNWTADFASLGADLTLEWGLRAVIYDAELDATVADGPRPPQFTAILNRDGINGNNWTPDGMLEVQVYSSQGGSLVAGPIQWQADPYGYFDLNLRDYGVNLETGMVVVVDDLNSGQSKELVLALLTIDNVDAQLDQVSGTAGEDTRLTVGFGEGEFGPGYRGGNWMEFDLFSDSSGGWLADFAAHDFDLTLGMWGNARVTDGDGDATQVDTFIGQPTIWARPHTDSVEVVDWPLDAMLFLSVDDDDDPANGVLFTTQSLVELSPHNGVTTMASFDLSGEFDILPGHIVRVSDGKTAKEVLITPLEITAIDIDTDVISGVADPFSTVLMHEGDIYQVTADGAGNWLFDLSGITDLDFGSDGFVFQEDDDLDRVEHHFHIEPPPYPCEPGDSVSGRVTLADGVTPLEWATVKFDDFDSGEPLYTVDTDADGYYSCYLPNGDYRISAVGDMYSTEYYQETIYENAARMQVITGTQFTDVNFTLDTPFIVADFLTFNMEDPVVGDVAVRQAIAYGLDRAAIIAASFPASPLMDSYLPPDHWAYADAGLMQYDFNPELAGSILDQAGWVDEDGDGVRERNGQRLHFVYVTTDYGPDHFRARIANIFVQNMADIGIEVDVWTDPSPWGRIFEDHDFGVAQFGWGYDVNGEVGGDVIWYYYATGNYLNAGSYHNPTADQMLSLISMFGTRAEMIPFLQQHQIAVMADLAVLPLAQRIEEEPEPPKLPPLLNFCVFGDDEVEIKANAVIDCNVASNGKLEVKENASIAGDVLSTQGTVKIYPGAHVMGTVTAGEAVELKTGVTVKGDVVSAGDVVLEKDSVVEGNVIAAGSVTLKDGAVVMGTIEEYASVPPIPPIVLPDISPIAGGEAIQVGQGDTLTLPPGTYGELEVKENATLILQSGHYDFEEIDVKQSAQIQLDLAAGPVTVDVSGKLELHASVQMAIISDQGSAADILFSVGKKVELKSSGQVLGTFLSPKSKMELKNDASLTGALYGSKVEVKERTHLYGDPAIDSFMERYAVE